jgi:acetate kinase
VTAETVLALNAGSSSLKAAVRTSESVRPAYSTLVERVGSSVDIGAAVEQVAGELATAKLRPVAVAHRVVHGGPTHHDPTVLDDALAAELQTLVPLAPLHLPGALETIAHARRHWPDAVHVACFDTGFHAAMPEPSRRLPVPTELDALGVRRYGFHGLSVQSVLLARPDISAAVVAHLGSGCSVTAVDEAGRSVFNTMSFTPTAGMMSSTRPGDLDPEIVLYLLEEHGYSTEQLRKLLNQAGGLAGVGGGRRDVRDLNEAAQVGDHDAALALEMFVQNAAMAIAGCATTLDRWETLVFTGGVGEHAAELRERIVARVRPYDVSVLVIPADEERVMDKLARAVLGPTSMR